MSGNRATQIRVKQRAPSWLMSRERANASRAAQISFFWGEEHEERAEAMQKRQKEEKEGGAESKWWRRREERCVGDRRLDAMKEFVEDVSVLAATNE